MPHGIVNLTPYLGTSGNPEALNLTTMYRPGELGSHVYLNNKAYQVVQLDSGCTSATGAGTPVCGHVLFWKDRTKYLVTNDKVQAEGGNEGAACGVAVSLTSGAAGTAAATAGNYCVVQQGGTHVGVLTVSTAAAANDSLVACATASSATPAVIKFSTGTAETSYPPIGVATAATSAVTANYTPCRLGAYDLAGQP